LKTSNLILDLEFDQHLESHKHVINIIMWFRDMGCYTDLDEEATDNEEVQRGSRDSGSKEKMWPKEQ
jgi:hypothetical protein